MPERPAIPGALKIVAALFLLGGVSGALEMIVKLLSGTLSLQFGALGIPAYFGLRRFSRGWRTFALFCIWGGLIVLPISAVAGLFLSTPVTFSFIGIPMGQIAPFWMTVIAIPFFALELWQYRVLTRPDIRALFYGPAENPPEGAP